MRGRTHDETKRRTCTPELEAAAVRVVKGGVRVLRQGAKALHGIGIEDYDRAEHHAEVVSPSAGR